MVDLVHNKARLQEKMHKADPN
uniref:Uncharacterized protein n=1 Tax=Rhizophora mucronata TaxID=61149 RepID=A0A2P2NV76_RHIMU